MAGRPTDLAIVDGIVSSNMAMDVRAPFLDATGLTVLPGLLDLQVNGVAGIDITAEPERLWEVGSALVAYGVTAFLPTVITSDPKAREAAMATFAQGPEDGWTGAIPLGLHFEGPMIATARKGAHPSGWLRSPNPAIVESWSREEGLLMATIAPELPGALEVIELLVSRGVIVSVGHTDANTNQVEAALTAGARCITHLGNAMQPMFAREPGPVGVALGDSDLVAGVIADGHHHHPRGLSALWKALGPHRFLSISDTTAALGLPSGATRLGDQEVVVADGTVRLADGTLAGSAASVTQCLRVLRETTGCSLADAVATATTTAADLIGDPLRGRLDPGCRGDLTLVETSDARFDVRATVVSGRVVHEVSG